MKRPQNAFPFLFGATIQALVWTIASTATGRNPFSNAGHETDLQNQPAQKSDRKQKSGGQNRGKGSRSTHELRQAFQDLIPPNGESLFDEKEMSDFLNSLGPDEVDRLVTDLLSEKSFPKLATAHLIYHWGQFDPLQAIAALETHGIKSDLLTQHIYAGWLKYDALAAFKHNEVGNPKKAQSLEYFNNKPYRRESLWDILSGLDPDLGIELLLELSSEEAALQISPSERDVVFEALPKNHNRERLSALFSEQKFTSKHKNFIFHEEGPG